MTTRQKDRVYLRWIGPADRAHGEFRGHPVELIGTHLHTYRSAGAARPVVEEGARVRFPDGSESLVHWDHLTDAPFRLGAP